MLKTLLTATAILAAVGTGTAMADDITISCDVGHTMAVSAEVPTGQAGQWLAIPQLRIVGAECVTGGQGGMTVTLTNVVGEPSFLTLEAADAFKNDIAHHGDIYDGDAGS